MFISLICLWCKWSGKNKQTDTIWPLRTFCKPYFLTHYWLKATWALFLTLTHVFTVLSQIFPNAHRFSTFFKSLFPLPLLFPTNLHPAFSQCAGRTQGGGERTSPLPPCCSRALPASRTSSSERKASQTASVTSPSSGLWRGEHEHFHMIDMVVPYSSIVLLLDGGEIFFSQQFVSSLQSNRWHRKCFLFSVLQATRKPADGWPDQYWALDEAQSHLLAGLLIVGLRCSPDSVPAESGD